MTFQPSPTNLNDELKHILSCVYYAGVQSTLKGATIRTPTMSREDAKAAITAAYAGAISEIIGEELDYDKYGKCPACGATYMYQCTCDQGSLYTINQQRQRLQRLLPTNGSDGGGAE